MDYLISMVVNRPYVVALVLTFAIAAAAERGWLRMITWLIVGSFIGWLSEFVSTRTGFPFSWYEYYPSSFPNDIWISNIPLFASLSFAALSYFGLSLTTTLFSPLRIGNRGVEREENDGIYLSLKTALWASLLITWTDFVVDPVAHLGEYWFLGKIYFWITKTAAWHFDIPLYNYAGWLITVFAIIYINQRMDQFMTARGLPPKQAFPLKNRCMWSLGYYIGNYVFILCVSIYLYFNPAVPEEKNIGLVLANTFVFVVAFIVFIGAVLLVKLRESVPFSKLSTM
jgi:putative membrane protein